MGRGLVTTEHGHESSDQWQRSHTSSMAVESIDHYQHRMMDYISLPEINSYSLSWTLLMSTLDSVGHDFMFRKSALSYNDQFILLKTNWHILLALLASQVCLIVILCYKWRILSINMSALISFKWKEFFFNHEITLRKILMAPPTAFLPSFQWQNPYRWPHIESS